MAHISKDIQTFKRQYRKTGSVRSSALAAGYSETVANMGLAGMPKTVVSYVLNKQKSMRKQAALARSVDPQMQEDFVRGSLIDNAIRGKDRATNSLKLLGQDKRVNMFGSDVQQGVFVLQMPAHLAKYVQPKTIDAEVIDPNPEVVG